MGMKYTILDKDKDNLIDFSKLKPGEVFSFFDMNSLKRTNHSIYMKIKPQGKNHYDHDIVDLTDGISYNFSEKKRVSLNDPDEVQANRVYVLDAKMNIIL
jgi:hypothetical protein